MAEWRARALSRDPLFIFGHNPIQSEGALDSGRTVLRKKRLGSKAIEASL